MVMDIIVICLILASAIFGARKGFALTIISFMQWFVCLIVAVLFNANVKRFIYDNTSIDEYINEAITKQLSTSVQGSSTYNSVPNFFSGFIEDGTNAAISTVADKITSIMLTVISFILILVVIKLFCFLIARIFSKKYHHGLLGFLDGLGGFLVGLFRGGVYVYIGFAILIPIIGLILPDISDTVIESLNTSSFAGDIYNNNILLEIVTGIFK